jgi:demethylmenaquinone methyltransferase / 2-methoxy-6-polyprenyl-1,4-benzoquinol methylase
MMSDVVGMFNRIAPRYDLLNRALSFGQDVLWRRRVAHAVAKNPVTNYLDVATGTGDLLFDVLARLPHVERAVGLDPAAAMLTRARAKAERRGSRTPEFVEGDALALPFGDSTFDAVTVGFGIRNMASVDGALREMRRVLKPGGRLYVLEFSLPSRRWVRWPYLFYFRHILPRVGGAMSGDSSAYRYLNKSVEAFPYGRDMTQIMGRAAFRNVSAHELTFGIACLYVGEKC